MTPTLDDLADRLRLMGHVDRIGEASFAVRTDDPILPRSAIVETTQADLEARLTDLARNNPWRREPGITAEEGAWRLLAVHVEEVIDCMDEDGLTVVIYGDTISVKDR